MYFPVGRDSSVSIATRSVLDCTRIESRWWVKYFAPGQTGRLASYTLRTGSFQGVMRPQRGVAHPPHLTQRLKKE